MRKCYIYRLKDPRNVSIENTIRYIGKTFCTPRNRLLEHILTSRKGATWKVCIWIRELLQQQLLPIIEIVEECDEIDWKNREIFNIKHYKEDLRFNLCNETKGGEGLHGFKATEETRQKMRNSRKGYIPVAAIAFNTGKKQSKESNEKRRIAHTGKKHSQESLEKQSKLKIEFYKTKEGKLAIEKGNVGRRKYKHTPERIAKIAAASKARPPKSEIHKYNLSISRKFNAIKRNYIKTEILLKEVITNRTSLRELQSQIDR